MSHFWVLKEDLKDLKDDEIVNTMARLFILSFLSLMSSLLLRLLMVGAYSYCDECWLTY